LRRLFICPLEHSIATIDIHFMEKGVYKG